MSRGNEKTAGLGALSESEARWERAGARLRCLRPSVFESMLRMVEAAARSEIVCGVDTIDDAYH